MEGFIAENANRGAVDPPLTNGGATTLVSSIAGVDEDDDVAANTGTNGSAPPVDNGPCANDDDAAQRAEDDTVNSSYQQQQQQQHHHSNGNATDKPRPEKKIIDLPKLIKPQVGSEFTVPYNIVNNYFSVGVVSMTRWVSEGGEKKAGKWTRNKTATAPRPLSVRHTSSRRLSTMRPMSMLSF